MCCLKGGANLIFILYPLVLLKLQYASKSFQTYIKNAGAGAHPALTKTLPESVALGSTLLTSGLVILTQVGREILEETLPWLLIPSPQHVWQMGVYTSAW